MIKFILLNYAIGLVGGWVLELAYRSYEAKKLIWPQMICAQMYGVATVLLYLLSLTIIPFALRLVLIAVIPTLIEFAVGYYYLAVRGTRLWTYEGERLNYRGIIRLEFSLYWFGFAVLYYFVVIPKIISLTHIL